MARTVDDIVQAKFGQLLLNQAVLQAKVEAQQDDIARLEAKLAAATKEPETKAE